MLQRWRVWGSGIVGAAFLSNLLVHAYLGIYSRFIADDYCSAGIARRFGVLRAVWYWYLNWTGRYSASALDAIAGLLGPQVTPLVTALVLAVWLAVLTYAAVILSGRSSRLGALHSFLLALTLLYLTVSLSPNVPQSLYWGQGMRSIVPPLILSAAYAAILAAFSRKQWRPTQHALWLLLGFVLTMFAGGLNETFAAVQLAVLVFALAMTLLTTHSEFGRRSTHFLIAGAAGAALAVVLVMIAPGNAYRQAFYPTPPGLLDMLGISIPGFVAFLSRPFSSPESWSSIAGAIGVSAFLGTRAAPLKRGPWLAPLILALGLAFSFLCFLPAAYGLSDAPPERTLMIPAYILSVALMLAGLIAGAQLASALPNGAPRESIALALIAIAAVASVGSAALSNARLLADRDAYAAYAAHWDQTNAQIISAQDSGKEQVLIATMSNWAGLNEPNDNPKFWVNVCYRQYYGIEVLAADQ